MSDVNDYLNSLGEHSADIWQSRCVSAEREVDELSEKLRKITDWCNAYPLDIFPEPNLKQARVLLEAGGQTLDAVSASAMRHVLKGIQAIIEGRQ